MTLTGLEGMTWERGDVSFLVCGPDSPLAGDTLVIDHEARTVKSVLNCNTLRSKKHIKREAARFLRLDMIQQTLDTEAAEWVQVGQVDADG